MTHEERNMLEILLLNMPDVVPTFAWLCQVLGICKP